MSSLPNPLLQLFPMGKFLGVELVAYHFVALLVLVNTFGNGFGFWAEKDVIAGFSA
jgi:hypothetical protein